MRSYKIFSLLSAAATVIAQETGKLGDAKPVNNNPVGAVYEAVLPEQPFFKAGSLEGNVRGSIVATSTMSGKGVTFKVKFENLPKEGGPFLYHLHVAPVPENGNCTQTLAHLDPYERGEATPCDKAKPETCQVGDLNGKHGSPESGTAPYEATYVDEFASTLEGLGAYFGNRSFAFHFANKTRITCANFKLVSGHQPTPSTHDNCTGTQPIGTGAVTPTRTFVPFPGAASTSSVPMTLLMLALTAIMFTF